MDFTSLGLFILRVGFGLTIALQHGLPKILDFANKTTSFPDPLGVGSTASLSLMVLAEFICGIFVALGLFTRLAVIPLIIAMGVAFFVFHAPDPFAKKEMAFLYFLAFTSIFAAGPGKFSVDGLIRGK